MLRQVLDSRAWLISTSAHVSTLGASCKNVLQFLLYKPNTLIQAAKVEHKQKIDLSCVTSAWIQRWLSWYKRCYGPTNCSKCVTLQIKLPQSVNAIRSCENCFMLHVQHQYTREWQYNNDTPSRRSWPISSYLVEDARDVLVLDHDGVKMHASYRYMILSIYQVTYSKYPSSIFESQSTSQACVPPPPPGPRYHSWW